MISTSIGEMSPEKTSQADQNTHASSSCGASRICVVGLGYVGLPTALLFARKGFEVHGVDVNSQVIAAIQQDQVGERYAELAPWWHEVKSLERFSASQSPLPADAFLIAVPTPVHPETKACDLSAVLSAVRSIVPILRPGNLVILESTVPPGTTRRHVKALIEAQGFKVGQDIHLCFSPERILPGNTLHELVHNHRILGSEFPESARLGADLLHQAVEGEIYLTDDLTAEFCKLAENTYRDVNIALANELSLIADELGVNIQNAIPLINKHPRVNLLQPGIGVGGHCIAVDPWFFVEVSPWKTELIGTSRRVNDRMPIYRAQQILQDVAGIENPRICLAGLTYKPDVADVRESPAMRIVQILKERGLDVIAYDPLLPDYQTTSLEEALTGADYFGILVNHSVLQKALSDKREHWLSLMRRPLIRVF